MIVLAMTKCNFPRLQFLAALFVKLQATVTGRADVIPKDISHMVQHANHTGRDGFRRRGTVSRGWHRTFCDYFRFWYST